MGVIIMSRMGPIVWRPGKSPMDSALLLPHILASWRDEIGSTHAMRLLSFHWKIRTDPGNESQIPESSEEIRLLCWSGRIPDAELIELRALGGREGKALKKKGRPDSAAPSSSAKRPAGHFL